MQTHYKLNVVTLFPRWYGIRKQHFSC